MWHSYVLALWAHRLWVALFIAALFAFIRYCFGAEPCFGQIGFFLMMTTYLFQVNVPLGALFLSLVSLGYALLWYVAVRWYLLYLILQTFLNAQTEYGWYGFWGCLSTARLYIAGLGAIPWLLGLLLLFFWVKW